MIRLRLLLLAAGAGTLLAGLPAGAAVRATPEPLPTGTAGEARALQLLTDAARAARSLSYRGTQYVSTWRAGTTSSHVADVRHTASGGSVVALRRTAGAAPATPVTMDTDLDLRLLHLLAEHYVLQTGREDTCTGRRTHVVEARRPGVEGEAAVAGRFWVDAESSLVLRREVFDASGRLVRSTAFASVDIGPADRSSLPDADEPLPAVDVTALRTQGWDVPASLAGHLELYDARLQEHEGGDVLHLSYSDGLSTLSLFAQRGRLGGRSLAGFAPQRLGRSSVWVRTASSPQRVVWGGSGQVFTLLTDAPPDTVRDVVAALPHDREPRTGILARIGRGLSRLASWLNPFD